MRLMDVKKKGLMTPALKDKYELHLLRKEDTAELHIATRIVFEKICVESVLDDFLFPKRKKKRDRGYRKIIRAIVGDPLQRKTG